MEKNRKRNEQKRNTGKTSMTNWKQATGITQVIMPQKRQWDTGGRGEETVRQYTAEGGRATENWRSRKVENTKEEERKGKIQTCVKEK